MWHTARVGSDHSGTAHTGFMGVCALPCGAHTTFYSLAVSLVVMVSCPDSVWPPVSGTRLFDVVLEYRIFDFLGDDFRINKVESVYGALLHFSAMLGSTVDTNLRESTELFCIRTQCLVRQ